MIIDGTTQAETTLSALQEAPTPKSFLAVLVMADAHGSFGFVREKERAATELGLDFSVEKIPADADTPAVEKRLKQLAEDPDCGGIVLQLPLANTLERHTLANHIPESKDVDLLGAEALGKFYQGESGLLPPAVGSTKTILKGLGFTLADKEVAVVGAGFLVGRPLTTWLLDKAQKVSVFEKGADLSELSSADLVISGTGHPGLIKPNMLKEGTGFLDFGYGKRDGMLSGDLDTSDEAALEKLRFYTPTPGGTGPILVSELMHNFYILN